MITAQGSLTGTSSSASEPGPPGGSRHLR